jgi:hypothetical protein
MLPQGSIFVNNNKKITFSFLCFLTCLSGVSVCVHTMMCLFLRQDVSASLLSLFVLRDIFHCWQQRTQKPFLCLCTSHCAIFNFPRILSARGVIFICSQHLSSKPTEATYTITICLTQSLQLHGKHDFAGGLCWIERRERWKRGKLHKRDRTPTVALHFHLTTCQMKFDPVNLNGRFFLES